MSVCTCVCVCVRVCVSVDAPKASSPPGPPRPLSLGTDPSTPKPRNRPFDPCACRYAEAGVPIVSWEPDNNWNVTYKEPKNWIGRSWQEFNKSLYPSGGESFVGALGNLSMVYYTNG